MLRALETLAITNTNAQASGNPFVVQQVPELRSKIMAGVDWKELAKEQLSKYFSQEAEKTDIDLLVKFADMYSGRDVETLSEGFKCANCFKQATQRCSRCKMVWYCCRECQADHYKKEHKLTCKILAEKMQGKSSKYPPTSPGQSEVLLKPAEQQSRTAPTQPQSQPTKKPLIEEVSSEPREESGESNNGNKLGGTAGDSEKTQGASEESQRNTLEELD